MPARRWLLPTLLLLLGAGLFSLACGGSSSSTTPPDLSRILTATPPETLPEPLIVGERSVPIDGTTYVVESGDVLGAIAERFGTTVDAIVAANGLDDPTQLAVGQVLVIPAALPDDSNVLGATDEPEATPVPDTPVPNTPVPVPDTPVPTDTPQVVDEPDTACAGHVVQEGEFPEVIASLYDLTTEELMAANPGLDPTTLQIGDCLDLP